MFQVPFSFWDAEGRMAQVVQGGTTYSTETYNAFGQRVETYYPGSGAKTDGVFDPAGNELGYYDAVGNAWYDRDIGLEGRMVAQAYPSDTYFLHANALGSDTQLTSHTGSVLMDSLHYPLGQVWQTAGTLLDAHFAGFQQSAGNYNTTPTRAYANTHGHWLTPDPFGGDITNPQTLNRYEYVSDSPTSFADPSGLSGPCGNLGQPPCGSQEPCDAGLWMPNCTPGFQFGFGSLMNWDPFTTQQMIVNGLDSIPPVDWYTVTMVSGLGSNEFTLPDMASWIPDVSLLGSTVFGNVLVRGSTPSSPSQVQTPNPPRQPGQTGKYGDYLVCTLGELANQGFGDPDLAGATILANVAPFALAAAGAIPAAYLAAGIQAIYDLHLALSIRATCKQEVYGL